MLVQLSSTQQAAQRVLKGRVREAFRRIPERNDPDLQTSRPPGDTAGDDPPSPTASTIRPPRPLNDEELKEWRAWADVEMLCRRTLLQTMARNIRRQFADLWSANDIWVRVEEVYGTYNSEYR